MAGEYLKHAMEFVWIVASILSVAVRRWLGSI
jgi:hypothetical protein